MIRIGLLGASHVALPAILTPAAARDDVTVIAIASRDAQRARVFAEAHGIARWYAGYDALMASPDVDLVYVGTHAPTHAALALRAIAAGKPVLVEKPFATSPDDARAVAEAADRAGLFVAEAMHSLHHPVFRVVLDAVRGGVIGAIRHIEARFEERAPRVANEHRWRADMGGGALFDIGVYLLAFVRALAGGEPHVVTAGADVAHGVDATSWAALRFQNGTTAHIRCGIDTSPAVSLLRIEGTQGEIRLDNPIVPHTGYRLEIETSRSTDVMTGDGITSYAAQLDAVIRTLAGGEPFALPHYDFVNATLAIDRVRQAMTKLKT